ncbi:MAG: nucleotidyltransferase family protein [Ekhidna sp.]
MSLNESSFNNKSIGLIVLAAGESNRLGKPKQLIRFRGKALLQHVLDESSKLQVSPKVLVLGAHSAAIQNEINADGYEVLKNENWREGMGSSLHAAMEHVLRSNQSLGGILILVSDQPFVSTELLQDMIHSFSGGSDIIACQYKDNLGVPALFGQDYCDELLKITGDRGAKSVIRKFSDRVKPITFEEGILDIDTKEDIAYLEKIEQDGRNS